MGREAVMQCRILHGDCREVLRDLPAESVHCVVTSPPYWGLRSYGGDEGMIGLERTFDEHLGNLVAVFREVRRVLRDDGTLWLNYGDAYCGYKGNNYQKNPEASNLQKNSQLPSGHDIGTPHTSGLKPKDLMMMPARVAMALQADGAADIHAMKAIMDVRNRIFDAYDGQDETPPDRILAVLEAMQIEYAQAKGESWWLRSEIIWAKPNPMPESVTDRPTNSHEKLFLLTKSAKYFYDAEAVRKPSNGWAGDFKPKCPERMEAQKFGGTRNEHNQATANLRNVWTIATHSYKGAHFATFPPKLVEPCIKAGTSERGVCGECGAPWTRNTYKGELIPDAKGYKPRGNIRDVGIGSGMRAAGYDKPTPNHHYVKQTTGWAPTCEHKADTVPATVLDPFAGSGTVGHVSLSLGRSFIGVEINAEYVEMGKRRTGSTAPLFTEVVDQ